MIIKNKNTFHLKGKNISYIMAINEHGDLLHYHYGKKLEDRDYSQKIQGSHGVGLCWDENRYPLESVAQEYPSYGHTDMRNPAYIALNENGNTISRLTFKSFKIKDNETAYVEGMPSLFKADNTPQTLEITLSDEVTLLEVVLSYTVFEEYDIILRSAKFINTSDRSISIESAYSTSIDFSNHGYDIVYFPGAWAREREFIRTPISMGEKIDISNARGGSGHAMNPFIMLCSKDATEKYGEVYGFSLIYSGNHSTFAECDQFGNVRLMQGINPFDFVQKLSPGEVFYTPQSVLCYSTKGFGGLSRELHDVYRNNLCKSKWAKKDRPILINNWEGTYFDFNEEKLLAIASKAKEAGVELFVLDDGWFGKRNDENTSLGDWVVNHEKLPNGIKGLAEKVNKLGLKFGLWFEPEMVSPDSDLYRNHPDWIISVPGRSPSLGRYQYMLDLSNDDVCNYIINSVSSILKDAEISYIKWDYNRTMADMPCKGYNHKYVLGFYKIMEALLSEFPDLLIEGCASGGGRFDPGILAYSPQIWTSDNSDAVSRLKIQYSTSMCYPLSSISAHITASPNHQVGRYTSLKTRADVAYTGAFGYELDITKMTEDELSAVKAQIDFYKTIQTLIRTGDFYRLRSPYNSNYCIWQIVSKDKSETVLFACRILSTAYTAEETISFEGLCENSLYVDTETNEIVGGDELMNKGINPVYAKADFATLLKHYKAIKVFKIPERCLEYRV